MIYIVTTQTLGILQVYRYPIRLIGQEPIHSLVPPNLYFARTFIIEPENA
jgi:hypothetical protein